MLHGRKIKQKPRAAQLRQRATLQACCGTVCVCHGPDIASLKQAVLGCGWSKQPTKICGSYNTWREVDHCKSSWWEIRLYSCLENIFGCPKRRLLRDSRRLLWGKKPGTGPLLAPEDPNLEYDWSTSLSLLPSTQLYTNHQQQLPRSKEWDREGKDNPSMEPWRGKRSSNGWSSLIYTAWTGTLIINMAFLLPERSWKLCVLLSFMSDRKRNSPERV